MMNRLWLSHWTLVPRKVAIIAAAALPILLAIVFPLQLGRYYPRGSTPLTFLIVTAIAVVSSLLGICILLRKRCYVLAVGLFVLFICAAFATALPIWFGRPWCEGHSLWYAPQRGGFILDGPVYAVWDVWAYLPPAVVFTSWLLIRWRKTTIGFALSIALVSAGLILMRLVDEVAEDHDFFYGAPQFRLILCGVLAPFFVIAVLYYMSCRAAVLHSKHQRPRRASKRMRVTRLVVTVAMVVAVFVIPIGCAPAAIEKEELEAAMRREGYYLALHLEMEAKALKSGIRLPRKVAEESGGPARVEVTRCWSYVPFIVNVSMRWRNERSAAPEYDAAYFWMPFGLVRLYKSHPF